MEKIDGCEKYYIKFHGLTDSQEYEISLDVFRLYYGEFKNPLEKKRDERRRHIEDGEIDGFIISGKLTVTQFEQEYADKADIDAVLRTCTATQQRRFKLHHVYGYTLEEIAAMENCIFQAVWKSVKAVEEKIKKYFFDG
jgi:RNA polymerase sigma-70 factor (ECF subfamily)